MMMISDEDLRRLFIGTNRDNEVAKYAPVNQARPFPRAVLPSLDRSAAPTLIFILFSAGLEATETSTNGEQAGAKS